MDRIVLAMVEAERAASEASQAAFAGDSGAPIAVVVGADPDDTVARLRIATDLRAAGLAVRGDLARRKLGRQLEAAVRDGARFAVIVGDELADGQVQLRDLGAASQKPVALSALATLLRRKAGGS
jgi:histidyl-tRNA synthetase